MKRQSETPQQRKSPMERFAGSVAIDAETGCWNWTKSVNRDGYAKFWDGSQMVLAHRWILQQVAGPFSIDTEADHLCRNRRCCNPCHLEGVSSLENKLRITQPQRRDTGHIDRDLSLIAVPS